MTRPATLTDFIDEAMRLRRTNAVEIERHTGLKATWIRNFKAGRIKQRPDVDNVHTLATHLQVDEAEIWQYLGRYDMVATLRTEPKPTRNEPGGADLTGLVIALTNALQAQAQALTDIQLALAQAARDAETDRRVTLELLGRLGSQLDELRSRVGSGDGPAVPGAGPKRN